MQNSHESPARPSQRFSAARLLFAAACLSVVMIPAPPASAQVEYGVISGTVTDSSRSVIPGAGITIIQLGTNRAFTALTDERGYYRSVPLQSGKYSVAASMAGFKRTVRSDVEVAIQGSTLVDFILEVGEITSEVTVLGDTPLLQALDASRGELIGGGRIVDMPLNGRNYLQLALLTVGTNTAAPGARGGGFSSGGLRASHNSYILDGIDNTNYQHAGTSNTLEIVQPSVDAIQAFKVQTNSYSAEFGGGLGAQVNVAIKSGTNRLHGAGFEFLRHHSFSARDFFADPNADKPPYKRNQFGGQVGGPIMADKTFFFGNYEGTLRRESNATVSTVPTAREKVGDFSQSTYVGQPVQLFDPETYNASTRRRLPFANNIIPQSRLDPVGAKIASFWPNPTRPGFVDNYLSNPLNQQDIHQFHLRIDHALTKKDTVFGRFSYATDVTAASVGAPLPPPAWGGGVAGQGLANKSRSFVLSWSRIFSAGLYNSLRMGYNRLATVRSAPTNEDINAQIGLTGTAPGPGMIDVYITGYGRLGHSAVSEPTSKTGQLTDDLTWIRGRNTLKLGFDTKLARVPQTHYRYSRGRVYFDGRFSRQESPRIGGHPVADLLLGVPRRTDLTTVNKSVQKRTLFGTYVQHDLRATRKLTFNLGVRYEYVGAWYERDDRYSNFDIDSGPKPYILLAKGGGIADRSTLDPDRNNFAPRLGIAYRVTDRTVVRTAYGIFYGSNDHYGDRYLSSSPPYHYTTTGLAGTIYPILYMRNGFPPGAVTTGIADMQTISVDRRNRTSYAQHWNLTIQRQLGKSLSLEIGYAGVKGTRLLAVTDPNQPPPGPGTVNPRRPWTLLEVPGLSYPVTLADTYRRQWSGNSNYHALEAKVEKRLSGGISFLSSYAWSKTIADSSGGELAGSGTPGSPQDNRNRAAERSVADEHRPHRWVTSLNWELPFGSGHRFLNAPSRPVQALLGGWALGGIVTLNSGRPVHVSTSGDPANTGGTNRPNRIADPILPRSERTLERWFNTAAFVANAPYTFGNSSRNPVRTPGYVNLDLAIFKDFKFTEERRLQFRTELFNATNTPHFGAPGGTQGTGTFGRIASAGDPRIIQFGLKFYF